VTECEPCRSGHHDEDKRKTVRLGDLTPKIDVGGEKNKEGGDEVGTPAIAVAGNECRFFLRKHQELLRPAV